MTRRRGQVTVGMVGVVLGILMVGMAYAAPATAPPLKGKYAVLKDEASLHTPGKVKLIEFADFYCPHCHMFERQILPLLEKEFGNRLEVIFVGFPIIPGKIPTPFDMYEQAKIMGKGPQMKQVLFRTIHKDGMQILDRTIRESLIKEVGLDPATFEAGLASGKPARAVEDSKKWGQRVQVEHTPTLILDGNIKLETVDPDNLKTVIRSILDADGKR
jgi:protein dithiol oxidoreductase (disulfide-forming)